jgi:mRNA interferase MazF
VPKTKLAITLDAGALRRLDRFVKSGRFANRSQAIEAGVLELLVRIERDRLATESARLDPAEEKAIADEGIGTDDWPDYSPMRAIRRGDIVWADLNPAPGHEQSGARPVLVLSQDVFNERSRTVIAVALTGREQRAGFPLTLEIEMRGLPKRPWVKISQIRTLAVDRLGDRIATAPPEVLGQVLDGLLEIIGGP